MRKLLLVAVSIIALSGCVVTNEQGGAVVGGLTGAVVGNQFGSGSGKTAATALGAVIGAMSGAAVGENMDKPNTVIYQNGVAPGRCSNIQNAGVRSECQRGLADRRRAEQRQAERRAYRYGRGLPANECSRIGLPLGKELPIHCFNQ